MSLHVFALTGGIGTGKSTVAALWRSLGLPVVDADVLARQATAPGSPGLDQVIARFGQEVVTTTGELDRKRLGKLVFGDPKARAELERIVHPRVREAAENSWSALEAQGEPLACYEVPLLFETGQAEAYRPVVVVRVSPEVQLSRAMARDAASTEQIRARIAAQMPLEEKVAQADYVIDNDGPLEQTHEMAREVLAELRRRFTD